MLLGKTLYSHSAGQASHLGRIAILPAASFLQNRWSFASVRYVLCVMRYALRVIVLDVYVFALLSFLLSLSLYRRHYDLVKTSSLFLVLMCVDSREL